MGATRKGDSIAERLLTLSCNILMIQKSFSRDVAGRHVARQLVRSATAGGALYEEARCSESRADLIHKVRVAAKELRESLYWLKLAQRVPLTTDIRVSELIAETDELVAIFIASAKTAKGS